MIMFTFTELGIFLPEYNGMRIDSVNAIIIDKAANMYRTLFGFEDYLDEDVFNHYNWNVDLVQGYISIPDNALVIPPQYA